MPSATAAPKVEVYNTPSPYSYSSIGPGPGAHISAPTPAPTPAEVLTAKRDAAAVAWLNGSTKTPPSASYMNYTNAKYRELYYFYYTKDKTCTCH